MAQTITAAGITANGTFPFVRVPLFELPASQTRKLAGVEMFAWNPLVTEEQRDEWASYVRQEQGWYEESKELLLGADDASLLTQTSYTNGTIRDTIWRGTAVTGVYELAPPPGPFAPVWQCSPPPFSPSFVNYNMLGEAFINSVLPLMIQTRDALMSPVDPTLSRLSGIAVSPEDHRIFHNQYVTGSHLTDPLFSFDHPHSVLLQPVFEELNNDDSRLVGFMASVVAWDRYVSHLLPDGVKGIVAVLRNTCGQNFTYLLDGEFVSSSDRTRDDDLYQDPYIPH
jgi:hypothetical protein